MVKRRAKLSEYGTAIKRKNKKQKLIYGVGEKQFRRYFDMASN